jgi:hypothetical protein
MNKLKRLLYKLRGVKHVSNEGHQPIWMTHYTLGNKDEEMKARDGLAQCLCDQFKILLNNVMDKEENIFRNDDFLIDIDNRNVTIGLSHKYVISITKL